MKRTISLLLSALMSFSACACQGEVVPAEEQPENQNEQPGEDPSSRKDSPSPVTEPFSIHYTEAVP